MVQINIAIYQTIDGIEVVAYRGASQPIPLIAGTNKVAIQMQKMIYKVGDAGPAGGIIFYVNPSAANTKAIIATLGAVGEAATAADGYELGGKNDWFLPSKDELNLMYVNLKEKNLGSFSGEFHWSSSQGDSANVSARNFKSGILNGQYKSNLCLVRPIRAFNPPSF